MSDKEQSISRREFLKLAGLSTLHLLGTYLGSLLLVDYFARKPMSKEGERLDFSTSGADYSLIQGVHGIALDKDTQFFGGQLNSKLLPSNFDAVVVEWTNSYLFSGGPSEIYDSCLNISFTRNIMTAVKDKKKDMLIVDLPIKALTTESLSFAIEKLLAYWGLDLVRKVINKEDIGGLSDTSKAATLAWRTISDFGSELAYYMNNVANDPHDELKKISSSGKTLIELMNPQHTSSVFRNAAVAAKMISLEGYYSQLKSHRPHFVMIGGIGHHSLPGFFDLGKQGCIDYMKLFYPSLLRQFILEDKESMYTMARVHHNQDGSLSEEFLIDPTLKEHFPD